LLAATHVLDARMPLIAVLGNHEMYGGPDEVIQRLRSSRIHLLVNEGAAVKSVWIAGISDFAARTPRSCPSATSSGIRPRLLVRTRRRVRSSGIDAGFFAVPPIVGQAAAQR